MKTIFKVFTQTSWQMLARLVGAFSNFLILALVTRTYGEEGTGIFTLALTYLAIFFLLADLGLNAYVLPKLSKLEANKLFNFRLIWSVLLVFLANLLAAVLPVGSPQFNEAVLIGSLSIVLSGIYNSVNLIFQKNLHYELSSVAALIGALSQIPVVLYLTWFNAPVSLLTLGPLFGWLVNNSLSLILVGKFFKFEIKRIDLSYPLKTLKNAWPVTLTLVLNVVYFRADAFILAGYRSIAEVGNYNLAYSIFQNALVLPTFIMNSYYPIMLKKLSLSRWIFFSQIKKAALILAGLAILGLVLTWLLADVLIRIIAGEGFAGSTLSLKILSLSFPAYFLSALLMWSYLSLKKYQSLVIIYLLGLLTNIGLNFIFIPHYSYLAASLITGISEYLILSLQVYILYWEFRVK